MNIEDCALRLMAEMADYATNTGRRFRDPYGFTTIAEHIEYLVRQGGNIETARWTVLDDSKEVVRVRFIMDGYAPECEAMTVD